MSDLPAQKRPCAECPWRTDVAPGRFPPERYELLARSAHDMSAVIFACHKSKEGGEVACAGFLLRGSAHNLSIRLALISGRLKLDDLSDGGFDLFGDYRAMAEANGVDPNHPTLKHCRGNGY